MLGFNSILVPVDFSSGSKRALRFGTYLADQLDVQLHVLHVRPGPKKPSQAFHEQLTARLAPYVAARKDIIVKAVGGRRPGEEIIRYAREADVDAILMGKHGTRATDRMLTYLGAYGQVIGATAEFVVRAADCPVLLSTPELVNRPGDISRILIALDFSPYTPAAIRVGRELAAVFDAEVDYLHVSSRPPIGLRRDDAEQPNGFDMSHFAVGHGQADRVIIDEVSDKEVDLLVIFSHGQTADRRTRIGHVAEKLIRSAPCSVLTVKAFGKALVQPEPYDQTIAAHLIREVGTAN